MRIAPVALAVVLRFRGVDGRTRSFPAGLDDVAACEKAATLVALYARVLVVFHECQDLG